MKCITLNGIWYRFMDTENLYVRMSFKRKHWREHCSILMVSHRQNYWIRITNITFKKCINWQIKIGWKFDRAYSLFAICKELDVSMHAFFKMHTDQSWARDVLYHYKPNVYSQTCLKRPVKGQKMWSQTGGLLTQLNYRKKCTLGALKKWSLNTGGLKGRFDCICLYIYGIYRSLNTEADTLA